MKHIRLATLTCCMFFILFLQVQPTQGAPVLPGDTLRLFVIGNSFSGNATRFLPAIAKAGGHTLIIGRAELGGCPLQRHWDCARAHELNAADSNGMPYNGKSLQELLAGDKWDIVTIQQYSMLSADIDSYRPYAKNLYELIKKIQPSAEVVMHQTWAYRVDAGGFAQIKDTIHAVSEKQMWEKSRMAYRSIANELGIRVMAVGDAFQKLSADKKYRFRRDPLFNYKQPVYPALPAESFSLHAGYSWDKNKKWAFDSHHASDAGCYLGGLVWYSFLFRADPTTVSFIPEGLSPAFAARLQQTARQVVKDVSL